MIQFAELYVLNLKNIKECTFKRTSQLSCFFFVNLDENQCHKRGNQTVFMNKPEKMDKKVYKKVETR